MLDRFSIALDHIEKKNKLITENSLCKNVCLERKFSSTKWTKTTNMHKMHTRGKIMIVSSDWFD